MRFAPVAPLVTFRAHFTGIAECARRGGIALRPRLTDRVARTRREFYMGMRGMSGFAAAILTRRLVARKTFTRFAWAGFTGFHKSPK
jgi:hypothetical protein